MKTDTLAKPSRTGWILLWTAASILPVAPYAAPLWQAALADSPYAYLVWIPAFAFAWAAWLLWRTPRYNDDGELNLLVGLFPILLAGGLLVYGMDRHPNTYVGESAGLLLWPLWSLGLAWMIFGVGVTRSLAKPLAYLLLAWPPIYSSVVAATTPVLDGLANGSIQRAAAGWNWVRESGSYGTYQIAHGSNWTPVYVSSVCSGSDSFLATLILFPIILVWFRGSLAKKIGVIAAGALLAILSNTVRLLAIIFALHLFGERFALGVLHPILGMILFAAMVVALLVFGSLLGLKTHPSISEIHLRIPGKVRAGAAVSATAALTVLLWPLYFWSPGSAVAPLPVATNNLSDIMPALPGYDRQLLGTFNDSSLLGPGATSTALMYSAPRRPSIMAELWWTNNPSALQTYGVHNCLLFHGDQIIHEQGVPLQNGIQGTAFTVLLPPSQIGGTRPLYEDLAYPVTFLYNGQKAYVRVELAYVISGSPAADRSVAQSIRPLVQSAADPGIASVPLDFSGAPQTLAGMRQFFSFSKDFSERLLQLPKTASGA